MATYITVEFPEEPTLAEQNLQWIERYRQFLLRSKGKQEIKVEQTQQDGSRQSFLSGTETVAGLRRNVESRFGHAHLYTHSTWPTARWTVFSGNYSAQLTDSEPFAPSPGGATGGQVFSVASFLLPVRNDACLLVMMGRLREQMISPSATLVTRKFINRAYIVSNKKVRSVSIPAKLQQIIDILSPPNTQADFESYEPPGVNTSPLPPRQIYDAAVGIAAPEAFDFTPTIFELLDNIVDYVDDRVLRSFPVSLLPVTYDFRYGAYAGDPVNKSLYYAKWTGDPLNVDTSKPDLLQGLPNATVWLPSGFQPPLPTGWNAAPDRQEAHLLSWTWGSPTYCRLLLGALGFSDAALTP